MIERERVTVSRGDGFERLDRRVRYLRTDAVSGKHDYLFVHDEYLLDVLSFLGYFIFYHTRGA